jgi:hypothetical protein
LTMENFTSYFQSLLMSFTFQARIFGTCPKVGRNG